MKTARVLAIVSLSGCLSLALPALAQDTGAAASQSQAGTSAQSQGGQYGQNSSAGQSSSSGQSANQPAAQTGAGQSAAASPAGSAASNVDQHVANLINTINQGEIDLANDVKSRSQNSTVQDLANKLSNDHQQAQSQLQSVAQQANLTLGSVNRMQNNEQRFKSRLDNMQGAKLDRAYVHHEIQDHRMAIHRLQALQNRVQNPALKSYVQQVIPQLQSHLQAARSAAKSLRSGQSSATPGAANPAGQATSSQTANADQPEAGGSAADENAGQSANAGQAGTTHHRAGAMPATGSPLGLLVLLGAGLTGTGLLRRKRS